MVQPKFPSISKRISPSFLGQPNSTLSPLFPFSSPELAAFPDCVAATLPHHTVPRSRDRLCHAPHPLALPCPTSPVGIQSKGRIKTGKWKPITEILILIWKSTIPLIACTFGNYQHLRNGHPDLFPFVDDPHPSPLPIAPFWHLPCSAGQSWRKRSPCRTRMTQNRSRWPTTVTSWRQRSLEKNAYCCAPLFATRSHYLLVP
jgi:hypothetical protein